MNREPVRVFGYTATGLLALACVVATAFLQAADWRSGLIAALAALSVGVGGTEALRQRVWSPASHEHAIRSARHDAATAARKSTTTRTRGAARKESS